MKSTKVTKETEVKQEYLKATATEDICVTVKNNDNDEIRSASLEIETCAGTVYVRGVTRKAKKGANKGKWFFCAPSHKYNDKYVDDVFYSKEMAETINNAINSLLS